MGKGYLIDMAYRVRDSNVYWKKYLDDKVYTHKITKTGKEVERVKEILREKYGKMLLDNQFQVYILRVNIESRVEDAIREKLPSSLKSCPEDELLDFIKKHL